MQLVAVVAVVAPRVRVAAQRREVLEVADQARRVVRQPGVRRRGRELQLLIMHEHDAVRVDRLVADRRARARELHRAQRLRELRAAPGRRARRIAARIPVVPSVVAPVDPSPPLQAASAAASAHPITRPRGSRTSWHARADAAVAPRHGDDRDRTASAPWPSGPAHRAGPRRRTPTRGLTTARTRRATCEAACTVATSRHVDDGPSAPRRSPGPRRSSCLGPPCGSRGLSGGRPPGPPGRVPQALCGRSVRLSAPSSVRFAGQ